MPKNVFMLEIFEHLPTKFPSAPLDFPFFLLLIYDSFYSILHYKCYRHCIKKKKIRDFRRTMEKCFPMKRIFLIFFRQFSKKTFLSEISIWIWKLCTTKNSTKYSFQMWIWFYFVFTNFPLRNMNFWSHFNWKETDHFTSKKKCT